MGYINQVIGTQPIRDGYEPQRLDALGAPRRVASGFAAAAQPAFQRRSPRRRPGSWGQWSTPWGQLVWYKPRCHQDFNIQKIMGGLWPTTWRTDNGPKNLSGTLWWTNMAMENHLMFNRKIHYKWQFSIAMLVHQRVYYNYGATQTHQRIKESMQRAVVLKTWDLSRKVTSAFPCRGKICSCQVRRKPLDEAHARRTSWWAWRYHSWSMHWFKFFPRETKVSTSKIGVNFRSTNWGWTLKRIVRTTFTSHDPRWTFAVNIFGINASIKNIISV